MDYIIPKAQCSLTCAETHIDMLAPPIRRYFGTSDWCLVVTSYPVSTRYAARPASQSV